MHLTLHYIFYIWIWTSGVACFTWWEVSKNAFNPGQSIVNIYLKLIKYVFLWNVVDLVFCDFVAPVPKFPFWVAGWSLAFNSNHFKFFLKIFLRSYVLSRSPTLIEQIIYSNSADNNLYQFYLLLEKPF